MTGRPNLTSYFLLQRDFADEIRMISFSFPTQAWKGPYFICKGGDESRVVQGGRDAAGPLGKR